MGERAVQFGIPKKWWVSAQNFQRGKTAKVGSRTKIDQAGVSVYSD